MRGVCGVRWVQANLVIGGHAGDGSFETCHLLRLDRLPDTNPPPDVRLRGM